MTLLDLEEELRDGIVGGQGVQPNVREVGPRGHHALESAEVLRSEELCRLSEGWGAEGRLSFLHVWSGA